MVVYHLLQYIFFSTMHYKKQKMVSNRPVFLNQMVTSVQYNDFKGLVIWPNSHFS